MKGHRRNSSFSQHAVKINIVCMPRKRIGLALSGGGARGFAHVGVLKVLEREGFKFDLIAGTSAGSIVGGALAGGMAASQIEEMARRTGYFNMFRPTISRFGLLSNAAMGRFLHRTLPADRFEALPTPLYVVAYDITAGKQRVFSESGDLITAIRASCAVPGVFKPIRDELGHLLVDGGVTSVMPSRTLREAGADVIIGVDLLGSGSVFRPKIHTVLSVLVRSAMKMIQISGREDKLAADVVITPQIAHLRPDQIGKIDEFISLGEAAAEASLDALRRAVQ